MCFSCAGNGFKVGKAPEPTILFKVTALNRTTGNREHIYNQNAKTAKQAISKSLKCYARASEAFRTEIDMSSAAAEVVA